MNNSFKKISCCRVCKNTKLDTCIDLGEQFLSGIFPSSVDKSMPNAPLELVKCSTSNSGCGLIQLNGTYDLDTMYGSNYGYRSGLNSHMIEHLNNKARKINELYNDKDSNIILDIAGNDGTFLSFFDQKDNLISIDPSADKFAEFYSEHVSYISDFFSSSLFKNKFKNKKAKIITSFSMFYDLENPCEFSREVNDVLDPNDGVWILEQSYAPQMYKMNSFDTICHEHLSYYCIKQLKYIMDSSNFKIIDIEMNDINGGSCSLTVANKKSKYVECIDKINHWIDYESKLRIDELSTWKAFDKKIENNKRDFYEILANIKKNGNKIAALGASTKGNVTLQSWELTNKDIDVIGDVNPDKWGKFTPGTWIPIDNEINVLSQYDYFVILPWHFKKFFLDNKKFIGKTFIFPLPTPKIIKV